MHTSINKLWIPWEVEKFKANEMSQVSSSYTFAFVIYDWLIKKHR